MDPTLTGSSLSKPQTPQCPEQRRARAPSPHRDPTAPTPLAKGIFRKQPRSCGYLIDSFFPIPGRASLSIRSRHVDLDSRIRQRFLLGLLSPGEYVGPGAARRPQLAVCAGAACSPASQGSARMPPGAASGQGGCSATGLSSAQVKKAKPESLAFSAALEKGVKPIAPRL